MWPLPEATHSHVAPYEGLLKEVIGQHRPRLASETASLRLATVRAQSDTILQFQMEVRETHGLTYIVEAQVLVDDENYIPLKMETVNAEQYTTTVSKTGDWNFADVNITTDPERFFYDLYL